MDWSWKYSLCTFFAQCSSSRSLTSEKWEHENLNLGQTFKTHLNHLTVILCTKATQQKILFTHFLFHAHQAGYQPQKIHWKCISHKNKIRLKLELFEVWTLSVSLLTNEILSFYLLWISIESEIIKNCAEFILLIGPVSGHSGVSDQKPLVISWPICCDLAQAAVWKLVCLHCSSGFWSKPPIKFSNQCTS